MNEKQFQAFITWLQDNGCQILKPTSQWEKLRYRHPDSGVCLIYVNKKRQTNWSDVVDGHIQSFTKKKPMQQVKRATGTTKQKLAQKVRARDGDDCCFCDEPPTPDNPLTMEHWFPVSKGGRNHVANLGLAHEPCNSRAGNLSVSEKIQLREAMIANKQFANDFSAGFFFMGEAS